MSAYIPGASCTRHSGESFNNYDNANDILGPVETSPILTTGSEDVIERGVRLRADSAKKVLCKLQRSKLWSRTS